MKLLSITFFLLLLLTTGCNNVNNQSGEQTQNEPSPESISYQQINENRPFNFNRFELEVDYVDRMSYHIDYVNLENRKEARIDDFDRQKVTGEEAFNQLAPQLREMSFDQDTPEDEVINEVLTVLGLEAPYKEFKLEVTYQDGTVVNYED
ncbi:YusW-like protein [Halobacillus alkaliphilus]|uniref:YusW-like protein n=1 Tax=Halobacillus alkaliphilus TaxID=396056 RepID=A0A1I2K0M6_9BACI|nr:YusW family protein [Halobacillus alkaliphilus]SFF60652.1 YusW-like protein [Halobacillus alkaliphilus]